MGAQRSALSAHGELEEYTYDDGSALACGRRA